MSFFSVPLSGLNASQSALQSISSNLANVDTDGYKDQNVTFNDVFAQTGVSNGALDPIQTGGGVATASTTSDFTAGNAVPTGIDSNMALAGDGFFVVQQPNGQIAYSRAGDFTTNHAGQLVAPDGSLVLGYPAQNGVVQTSAPLQPLQVGTGAVSPAVATTSFSTNVNLQATAAAGAVVPATISVYDSLGGAHTLSVNFTKGSTDLATGTTTWNYAITVPSADSGSGVTGGTGTLTFDDTGKLTGSATTTTVPGPPPTTTSTPNPAGSVPGISISGLTDGAAPLNLTWNLKDAGGNETLTESSLASTQSSATQNGSPTSTLGTYTIEADGTIAGSIATGTIALGQVAVATVVNTQGLQQIGSNLYQTTQGSGLASVGIAGTGGRGAIKGGYVEQSNVNEANEFSKLIVAQQAYEANAKAITTFNQVEQATIQIIQ